MYVVQYCICQVLDDEYHFLFKCQLLQDLRVKYIKRYYYTRPSMNKLLQLLSSENKAHIRNLSVFIKKGLNNKVILCAYEHIF